MIFIIMMITGQTLEKCSHSYEQIWSIPLQQSQRYFNHNSRLRLSKNEQIKRIRAKSNTFNSNCPTHSLILCIIYYNHLQTPIIPIPIPITIIPNSIHSLFLTPPLILFPNRLGAAVDLRLKVSVMIGGKVETEVDPPMTDEPDGPTCPGFEIAVGTGRGFALCV
jgi:hypothetical protein